MHDAKHCRNSHTTVMFVTRQNLVDQLFHTRLQVSLWRVYRCSFVFCSWTEVAVAIPRQSTQKQFVVCNFIWIVPITLQHYQWAHHWIVQFSLPSRKCLWHFIFLFLYAPSDVSEEATRAQRCVCRMPINAAKKSRSTVTTLTGVFYIVLFVSKDTFNFSHY